MNRTNWSTLMQLIHMRQLETTGATTLKDLARASGIDYDRMLRINKDPAGMRLWEFMAICKAIRMSPEKLKEVV